MSNIPASFVCDPLYPSFKWHNAWPSNCIQVAERLQLPDAFDISIWPYTVPCIHVHY